MSVNVLIQGRSAAQKAVGPPDGQFTITLGILHRVLIRGSLGLFRGGAIGSFLFSFERLWRDLPTLVMEGGGLDSIDVDFPFWTHQGTQSDNILTERDSDEQFSDVSDLLPVDTN